MGASELSWWLKKEKDEDKSEEQWKTIWVVVLKVTVLVLLFGLTASVAVFILKYNHGEDQTQSWTKGVEGYPAWEEVVDLILEAEQNLPEIVNVGVIGRSSEGRPIHSVTVGGKEDKEEGGGRLVLIICGLHAREWMSVLACIHILQALIQVKRSYLLTQILLFACNERQNEWQNALFRGSCIRP